MMYAINWRSRTSVVARGADEPKAGHPDPTTEALAADPETVRSAVEMVFDSYGEAYRDWLFRKT
jgi:hypothetical protein